MEVVRTGLVAMRRGAKSPSVAAKQSADRVIHDDSVSQSSACSTRLYVAPQPDKHTERAHNHHRSHPL